MWGIFSVARPYRKSAPMARAANSESGITLEASFALRCAGAMTIKRPYMLKVSGMRSQDHMPTSSSSRLNTPTKTSFPVSPSMHTLAV